MSLLINALTEKDTYTDNGALTNSTTHNSNLDLFFLAGACRKESDENIEKILVKSYAEDKIKTLKIIFWAGDIRQGAGERRFFSVALKWLYTNHKDDLYKYLYQVPEFSRWDVLFQFDDNFILDYIIKNFKDGNALLCKWLPRKTEKIDTFKNEIKAKLSLKGSVNCVTDLPQIHNYKKYDVFNVKKDNLVFMWGGKAWVEVKEKDNKFYYIKKKKRLVKNGYAFRFRKRLGLSEKQYREHLVKYTNVVETKMCAKKWDEINYEQVPSVAMNKYNKAWYRNDEERFTSYLESVDKGEKKINASAIFPHDILGSCLWGDNIKPINAAKVTQWNNLPNYMTEGSILPICDVSGSMTWENNALAYKISVSLGLYISERNKGIFKDAFITFSSNPQVQYLKGTIVDRINQLNRQDIGYNTDIEKVFRVILDKAVCNRIPENEMPKTVLIISDMEFDEGTTGTQTSHEVIKNMYIKAGYKCPNLVYWNVNGRVNNCPITMNTYGAALISGASPSIIKSVLCDEIDPIKIMNKTIESERYAFIK